MITFALLALFAPPPDPAPDAAGVPPPPPPELSQAPTEDVRRLTLRECIDIALTENRMIAIEKAQLDEAEAARKVARGRFGPVLNVNAGLQVWDKETRVAFSLPTIPGVMIPPAEPLVVQEQVTSTVRTSLFQPLTGLWGISEGYLARKKASNAASLEVRAQEQSTALEVANAYYEALKFERLVEVARVTVETIEASRAQAETLYKAGSLSRDQLLEADVRLAQSKSSLIEARGAVRMARANLAFTMGLPVDSDIAPAPIEKSELPKVERDLSALSERAAGNRSEVAAASLRVDQAKHARRAATSTMLPQITAGATYQHTEGQAFQRRDLFYFGLTLDWNVWEWGAKYYQVPEAKARERQAKLAEAQVREGIRLELQQAIIGLEVAEEKLQATQVAVEQSEENLRIVQKRFGAAAATTTQVLDAAARKARTEADQATAYYDYLKALAAYQRTVGELVESKASAKR